MKQQSKQEAFREALAEAIRLWNTGAIAINTAAKAAAKKHKVNAKELVEYMFEHTKNKSL